MRAPRLMLPVSLLVLLASVPTFTADPAVATMTGAANAFLSSLGAEQKQKAQFAFDAAERTHWHFIPTEMFPRSGLTLHDMSATQRSAAQNLLKSGLSQHGYTTATTIMSLENILRVVEAGGQFDRDPERYFFAVFGMTAMVLTYDVPPGQDLFFGTPFTALRTCRTAATPWS